MNDQTDRPNQSDQTAQTNRPARRLSYAEAMHIEETQGRFCRGCRTIYTPEQIPTSFGMDNRTKDHLTRLCLTCISRRDAIVAVRVSSGKTEIQAAYRDARRRILIEAAQAHVDEYLAHDPPTHAIPLRAIPGYPPATPRIKRTKRTKQEDAMLTILYGKLRDIPIATWEQLAGGSRREIPDYLRLGYRSLATIDEHLRALGLEPLRP